MLSSARYIMIGGFLGAGKTTALRAIAHKLTEQGKLVGLITNDQSVGLVDTAVLESDGWPVAEITGGCFCCKFNSLLEAAGKLTEQAQTDIFLAEPVGSCTDLVATVHFPLRQMYHDRYTVAPLSVLVDPQRARRVLGIDQGAAFSDKVRYIYGKQLQEADIIVINKIDLLNATSLQELTQALRQRFPNATILHISARNGTGVDEWLELILTGKAASGTAMDVDYDEYAEGEALLGWLNASAHLSATSPFEGNALLRQLAADVQQRLRAAGTEIAHLKMTLVPDEGNDLGVLNLVATETEPELAHALQEELTSGELLLNLRAEADPAFLHTAVKTALTEMLAKRGMALDMHHLEAFRPGRPVPTHRVAELQEAAS